MKADIVVDHLDYLRESGHRRATHARFRRHIRERRSGHCQILHEADWSCCEIEPWPVTAERIQAALAADGERPGWVMLVRPA